MTPRILPLAQHVHRRRRSGRGRRPEHIEDVAERVERDLDLAAGNVVVVRRHAALPGRRLDVAIKVPRLHGRYSGPARMATATTETGPRLDAEGLQIAVAAPDATAVELCVRTVDGRERRQPMQRAGDVFTGRVDGAREGLRYGFRAHGPGCDPAVLLIDPLARAVDGRWSIAVTDRAATSAPLRRPLRDTVIYEAHVRGLTRLHPGVPPALRGTYAGLAHPAAIAELTRLGVTAVELLPVFEFRDEQHLRAIGRRNFWGYSPVAFCAPHAAYAASGPGGGQVAEFRGMVAALHEAGIEVLLDVVYNHTAEGGDDAWSLRGLGPRSFFREHDV